VFLDQSASFFFFFLLLKTITVANAKGLLSFEYSKYKKNLDEERDLPESLLFKSNDIAQHLHLPASFENLVEE
jgi:hypothetical protein